MIHRYLAQITKQTNLSAREAWWLLEHVLQPTPIVLALQYDLTTKQQQQLQEYIDQIAVAHKPLAYIIGWVPFLDLRIEVQSPILIPRPETEQWLYELTQQLTPHKGQIRRILDIGTGSGAIALALAKNMPTAEIIALDINPAALDLARKNAMISNVKNVEFAESDLFSSLKAGQSFDLIVSNPPYIPRQALVGMSPSVVDWEDHGALFADQDGVDLIHKILAQATDFLAYNPDLPFQLVLEIDQTQSDLVKKIAQSYGWDCKVTQDLFGNWRTIWCKKQL